ncbi:hypothetical protein JCM6882_003798 [Rhodosporidiobolus microsporus]
MLTVLDLLDALHPSTFPLLVLAPKDVPHEVIYRPDLAVQLEETFRAAFRDDLERRGLLDLDLETAVPSPTTTALWSTQNHLKRWASPLHDLRTRSDARETFAGLVRAACSAVEVIDRALGGEDPAAPGAVIRTVTERYVRDMEDDLRVLRVRFGDGVEQEEAKCYSGSDSAGAEPDFLSHPPRLNTECEFVFSET